VNTLLEEATGAPTNHGRGIWTADYLLSHCEGYLVDGPDGHVGFVAEVIETDESFELAVATPDGDVRVPIDEVHYLDPGAERIGIRVTPR
jgi:hypothetical protein